VWRIWLTCFLLTLVVWAKPVQFVRMNDKTFDTAVTRYQRGPLRVDLVAVVHVGEAAYYQRLNQLFRGYDVVLYELIAQPPGDPNREELYDLVGMKAPKSNPVPHAGDTSNAFLRELASQLDLEFQLDWIDYQADNFLHADITPAQLSKLLGKKKAKPQEILKQLLDGLKHPSTINQVDLLGLYTGPPNPAGQKRLRRFLGQVLLEPDAFDKAVHGNETNAYIFKRNAKALKVLQSELAGGRRKVAIFYGAAHMPDLARHLEKDFHFQRRSQDWLTAWKLNP